MKKIAHKYKLSLFLLVIPAVVLAIGATSRTIYTDTLSTKTTNGDITISPNGSGDVVVGSYSGVLKASSGTLSAADVILTSEVSGILPVANGGTGSATQNFVDLTTNQTTIAGNKTFTGKLATSTTSNGAIPCPVMTEAQRDAITGDVEGDCVFNSDDNVIDVYDGANWYPLGEPSQTVESCFYSNNGTAALVSSNCNDWIASISRTALGQVTITLTSSYFSAAPDCTCTTEGGNIDNCGVNSTSTSQVITTNYRIDNDSSRDLDQFIICKGPR